MYRLRLDHDLLLRGEGQGWMSHRVWPVCGNVKSLLRLRAAPAELLSLAFTAELIVYQVGILSVTAFLLHWRHAPTGLGLNSGGATHVSCIRAGVESAIEVGSHSLASACNSTGRWTAGKGDNSVSEWHDTTAGQ